jgi:hypothetical protein
VEPELLCRLIRILSAGLSWAEMVVSAKMSFPGFKGIASVPTASARLMRRCWGKEEGEDVGALGGEEFALVRVDEYFERGAGTGFGLTDRGEVKESKTEAWWVDGDAISSRKGNEIGVMGLLG